MVAKRRPSFLLKLYLCSHRLQTGLSSAWSFEVQLVVFFRSGILRCAVSHPGDIYVLQCVGSVESSSLIRHMPYS